MGKVETSKMRENLSTHRTIKPVLLIIIFVTLGTIGIIVYYQYTHGPSRQQVILNDAKILSFHGKVDSIYFDKANHDVETLILSSGYQYWLYPDWSSMVSIGDSLSKDLGTLQVKVYRKNTIKDTLDYQKLAKTIK